MRPASAKGPKGRARPKTNPFSINWKLSNVPVWIKTQAPTPNPSDQVEGVQTKEISKSKIIGLSTGTNLTNFEDDNSDEWEEKIMVRKGLNIPEDIKEHINDLQLMSEMRKSEVLLNSMIRSIRNVKDCLRPNDRVTAYKEGDERDVFQKNRLKIELDIEDCEDNLDEWRQRKKEIKEAVRNAEEEDVMIYTFVDRKRN